MAWSEIKNAKLGVVEQASWATISGGWLGGFDKAVAQYCRAVEDAIVAIGRVIALDFRPHDGTALVTIAPPDGSEPTRALFERRYLCQQAGDLALGDEVEVRFAEGEWPRLTKRAEETNIEHWIPPPSHPHIKPPEYRCYRLGSLTDTNRKFAIEANLWAMEQYGFLRCPAGMRHGLYLADGDQGVYVYAPESVAKKRDEYERALAAAFPRRPSARTVLAEKMKRRSEARLLRNAERADCTLTRECARAELLARMEARKPRMPDIRDEWDNLPDAIDEGIVPRGAR